jgi:hypothetical protein
MFVPKLVCNKTDGALKALKVGIKPFELLSALKLENSAQIDDAHFSELDIE